MGNAGARFVETLQDPKTWLFAVFAALSNILNSVRPCLSRAGLRGGILTTLLLARLLPHSTFGRVSTRLYWMDRLEPPWICASDA